MQYAIANVYWYKPAEGGRKHIPIQGLPYYPHIKLHSKPNEVWSVCVYTEQVDANNESVIAFSPLARNEEALIFFSSLDNGMEFRLLEGNKVVAIGQITGLRPLPKDRMQ